MVCLLEPILIASHNDSLFHLRLYYYPDKEQYQILDDDPFIGQIIRIGQPFTIESNDLAIERFKGFIISLTGNTSNVVINA